jgi:hypothetical protein
VPDVTITSSIATESKYVTPIANVLWGNTKGFVMKLETSSRTPIDPRRDGGSSTASAMVAWIAAMLLLIAEAVAILAVAMPARSSAAPVEPTSHLQRLHRHTEYETLRATHPVDRPVVLRSGDRCLGVLLSPSLV